QKEFAKIEHKLWYIITTPAMYLTIAAGIAMLAIKPAYLHGSWMQVKLGFVGLLLMYHFICQRIMKQLATGKFKNSSFKLRLWNEVATILLVAIVFTVVLKSAVNWVYGLIGLIIFSVVIMGAVKWYKSYRNKNNNIK
ncbi:MAG: protoporphyrinogen IX oxidase, partial [Chitinophagaceae bacterium]